MLMDFSCKAMTFGRLLGRGCRNIGGGSLDSVMTFDIFLRSGGGLIQTFRDMRIVWSTRSMLDETFMGDLREGVVTCGGSSLAGIVWYRDIMLSWRSRGTTCSGTLC